MAAIPFTDKNYISSGLLVPVGSYMYNNGKNLSLKEWKFQEALENLKKISIFSRKNF